VRKVLDWPNHRVGSKPSDPVRFEQSSSDTVCPDCGQDLAEMASEDMDKHVLQHHPEWKEKWYGEQGDASTGQGWEGQSQGDPSQQLNPTTQQNVSPFTQSQFTPTSTQMTAPTGKGEGDVDDYILFDCPDCGFPWAMGPEEQADALKAGKWVCSQCGYSYPIGDVEDFIELEFGPDEDNGDELQEESSEFTGEAQFSEEEHKILHHEGRYAECPTCFPQRDWESKTYGKKEYSLDCEPSCVECVMDNDVCPNNCADCNEVIKEQKEGQSKSEEVVCPECGGAMSYYGGDTNSWICDECGHSEYQGRKTEELKDPRIAEKDKGKEPESQLSPEAQKVAGTDPATVEAKSKEKPKLEVDVSDKITILGKTGSGKTNLIKVLLSDILKDYQFILLDALGNFAEYNGQPNIDYHQVTPSDQAGVDEIIYAALERGDCMIVLDEVDRYNSKPGSMLNELVNVGRNYNVGGIFAARRTADVNKDILANSPYIFTFQHILPQDLDVLIDWFAQDETVFRDLQEFEAILFHNGEQMWVGKVPEKPTTKPTAKPTPPKKPKGKDKEKGKEPEPEKGKEPSEPKEKGPPTPSIGEGGKEPELPPEGEPPEEEPTEEPEAEKQEGAFRCEFDGQAFKYEKDYLNHLNTHAGR